MRPRAAVHSGKCFGLGLLFNLRGELWKEKGEGKTLWGPGSGAGQSEHGKEQKRKRKDMKEVGRWVGRCGPVVAQSADAGHFLAAAWSFL